MLKVALSTCRGGSFPEHRIIRASVGLTCDHIWCQNHAQRSRRFIASGVSIGICSVGHQALSVLSVVESVDKEG